MHWQAEYEDGTIIDENDGISADKLKREGLIGFGVGDEHPELMLHLDPGDRFFYRRRTEKTVHSEDSGICHILGRFKGMDMIVAFVFENGIVHLASRFDDKHPWFYSPEFLPGEV